MIDFQQVQVSHGAQTVLAGASFRVNPGERVGIVGPNGAGKSTVFSLLCGELTPDSGAVTVPRSTRLGHLRQQLNPARNDETLQEYVQSGAPELQAIHDRIHALDHRLKHADGAERERVLKELGELQTRFESLGGYDLRARAEAALTALGFDPDRLADPFGALSGGWQMRAELVRVTVWRPDLLLMDEPTNYLDIPAVEWLQRFLRDYPGTLLLISHDRYLLNALSNVTIEIANGEATRYEGPYDRYVEERQRRFAAVIAARRNQARKREQAERFIERFRAKNTKATQVQSKIKMLERMEEVEAPRDIVSPGAIRLPTPARCGREVARLDDAGYSYDGKRWVLRHVNLAIERGDRFALVGLNGKGKTTLLRLLAGLLEPGEGRRRIGHKVEIGYQSQEFADTMNAQRTALETVKQAALDASEQEVRTLLGGFGFSGAAVDKPVAVLSGGEKVRLAFARLLVRPPNFLLLDEPTTHLDIAARQALEEALLQFEGTLCVVSHDIAFVRRVANGIIAMTPPSITRYWGGYDHYREKLAAAEAAAEAARPAAPASPERSDRRARAERVQAFSRRRRAIQSHVNRVEGKIAKLETRQTELLASLGKDRAANVDYDEVNRGLARVQQRLNDENRRWEALAIELDELEREYQEETA